eukprot:Skav234718  [mRNA]  locus=scaffold634:256818:269551:- [translate_table: standard]
MAIAMAQPGGNRRLAPSGPSSKGCVWFPVGRQSRRYVNLTTNAYTVGVVASVLLLRWGRAEEDSLAVLLGPKELRWEVQRLRLKCEEQEKDAREQADLRATCTSVARSMRRSASSSRSEGKKDFL